MSAETEPFDPLEALAAAAHMTYSACLVGNPAPVVSAMYAWLKRYDVGHLVLETTTSFRPFEPHRVGVVEKIEDALVCSHELRSPNVTCDKCPDDERFNEHFVWLRTATGLHRWHNADFIRVPRNKTERKEAQEPQ